SGSGKSSLLQAGLWPRLLQQQHRCVYVKFSDLAPLEAIRQAFREQQAIPSDSAPDSDLITLLRSASQADARPLVLLFDQFEQFFAHRKLKQTREPFLRAMADWYVGQAELGIKVLVCIRGDFSDRLIELQRAMGYALGPQQNFRIEKFEPEEATQILSVIAE